MKYQPKLTVIEAMQFDGTNAKEIHEWSEGVVCQAEDIQGTYLYINADQGMLIINPMDFVIRGVNGEFYQCKQDIFNDTYELHP
jgi:hypothetical protein